MIIFLNGRLKETKAIMCQVKETIKLSQDTYTCIVNSQMNDKSNDLNEAMRVFASIATMFLPLQVISGIFGMNVKVPMQYVDSIGPFYYVVGGMGLFMLVLYLVFKRRKWL